MNKNSIISGAIVVLLVVVGLAIWFWTTLPSEEEISRASNPPPAIDVNILKSSIAQKVQKRDKNGDIPVTVSAEEIGRDDPFSSY